MSHFSKKNRQKLTIFGNSNTLLSTQNINIARFARNVECDFFCDFQPLCSSEFVWPLPVLIAFLSERELPQIWLRSSQCVIWSCCGNKMKIILSYSFDQTQLQSTFAAIHQVNSKESDFWRFFLRNILGLFEISIQDFQRFFRIFCGIFWVF